MGAFNPVFAPLSVEMSNTVEVWVISVIDFANNRPICLRLVGHDGTVALVEGLG